MGPIKIENHPTFGLRKGSPSKLRLKNPLKKLGVYTGIVIATSSKRPSYDESERGLLRGTFTQN
jgi:hypothetical protein